MKTKMPSILKVNYPMLKVDIELFFLKIPSFSSTCCTNTNKLTNQRKYPKIVQSRQKFHPGERIAV